MFVRHENGDALEYINRRAGDRNRKLFWARCEYEEQLGLYDFWKSLRFGLVFGFFRRYLLKAGVETLSSTSLMLEIARVHGGMDLDCG